MRRGILTGLSLLLATTAQAAPPVEEPPAGRYRCYVAPNWQVTGWFELLGSGAYRTETGATGRYQYEPASRRITWRSGDLAERDLAGLHYPPGAGGPGGDRHSILLRHRKLAGQPGKREIASLPQCLLIRH